MIFGSESISAFSKSNLAIWMLLAFQAGLINIGGFMAAQTFVSHVTGLATMSALDLESNRLSHATGLLIVLFSFLLGAMGSGGLIDLKLRQNKKPQYFVVFGVLFALCLVTAVCGFNQVFGEFGRTVTDIRGYFLVILLSFTCGLQNGIITLVSKSIVRTTHLTGLVTDLGIGLVRSFNRSKTGPNDSEWTANYMRVGIIISFFAGSIAGVPLFRTFHFSGFVVPCLISGGLFAMSLYFQVLRRDR
jgi:uncharacterized membrane protein YoaK (UPF0700 family)